MSFTEIKNPESDLAPLIAQAFAKLGGCNITPTGPWLLVDVAKQRLFRLKKLVPLGFWPVSTARSGLDNRQDSGGTPAGVHRIAEKIGEDCPTGTIFSSRKPTGEIWHPGQVSPDDLILTRILTLSGCEPGLNQGAGVDSLARYIYLHGTNHEELIGQAVSHGCVRLTNTDIHDVFDRSQQGDPVVII